MPRSRRRFCYRPSVAKRSAMHGELLGRQRQFFSKNHIGRFVADAEAIYSYEGYAKEYENTLIVRPKPSQG